MTTAIKFENVSKKYKLYSKGGLYLRDRVTHALGRLNPFNHFPRNPEKPTAGTQEPLERDFWALKNISFDIKEGESIGFIGRNGAGKSTILKLLAGVTRPSSGIAAVSGRVAALIEVGAGFHPELTGRENIYLNGSILGMKKAEIDNCFDSIVAFAEIEQFMDTPVKHYSSGMYVRLGFAIAAHTDPDIYLIDEVLAVGDEAFQKKCLGTLAEHIAAGKTMILVSHQLDKIEEVCERCIYLDHGEIRYDGDPIDAIERYRLDVRENRSNSPRSDGMSGEEARIAEVIFRDRNGQRKHGFETGDDLIVEIQYNAMRRIDQPVFGISFRHPSKTDVVLASFNTRAQATALDPIEGKGSIFCRISNLPFLEGKYLVSVVIHDHDLTKTYDYHYIRYELEISGKEAHVHGLIQLSPDWSTELSVGDSLAPMHKRKGAIG